MRKFGNDDIYWDFEDDPDPNIQHIREHDVTPEEVEEILLDPGNPTTTSNSSGRRITFGWASTGRHLAVVWDLVDPEEGGSPMAYPVTAYESPPRRGRRHEPKRKR